VNRYVANGLRVPTVTAAKILTAATDTRAPSRHELRLQKDLERSGWTYNRARTFASAVHDSLAIEAKVRDWRAGVRQISRFRRSFERSALLLPTASANAAMEETLNAYGCGLLVEASGRVDWKLAGQRVEPPLWARLWTLEVVARSIESGAGYRVVSRANSSNASA